MLKVIILLILLLLLGYLVEPFMTSAWESIKKEIADEPASQQHFDNSPRPVPPQPVASSPGQDETDMEMEWTPEEIVKNPLRYCNVQIKSLNAISERLEKNQITLYQMQNRTLVSIEKNKRLRVVFEEFLTEAKAQYKSAEASGKWPAHVDGMDFSRERLQEKIIEADRKLQEIAAEEGSLANRATLLKRRIESNFATQRKVATLRKDTTNIINDIKLQRIVIDEDNLKSILGDLSDSINALNANQDSPELKDIMAQ